MENQDWITSDGVPFLNGSNYTTLKVRMKIYLQSLDFDVWLSMENGVINYKLDKQVRNEILRGLSKANIKKIIYFKITKELWDKL